MITEFIKLYNRDLDVLSKEITLFKNEELLWKTTGSVTNSAGNLCLHLCGNLNNFVGNQLGNSGYVRNREFEFAGKDVPRDTLIKQIKETKEAVEKALHRINDEELKNPYPLSFLGFDMTIGYTLSHLLAHFSYHLGQINYLRRVL